MRANMKGKPLDFPREYFEIRCTTAEKKYLEYLRELRRADLEDRKPKY